MESQEHHMPVDSESVTSQFPAGDKSTRGTREVWGVTLFMLGFLLVNLITASRYPFVWIDEVMYSDPGVNLYLGKGFTSTAWYVQPSNEFWAGNVPLHSALLCVWLKVFGFSITAVRSINYFYFIAAGLLLWRACIRLGLIKTSWARLLLLALMAGGYSLIFSYRSGRPDCLALLVVCGLVCCFAMKPSARRQLGFLFLGTLSPWVGLQLLPLIVVASALLLLYLGRTVLPVVVATVAGATTGVLALVLFYASHGVFAGFLKSIKQHTTVGVMEMLAGGQFRHSNFIPKDFSFIILLTLAVALVVHQFRSGAFKRTSVLSFGLVYSLALSTALVASGKFPTYYGWMTYVPLSVCLCSTLSEIAVRRKLFIASLAFIWTAVSVGISLNLMTAAYDWKERAYANVENLVQENVLTTDWMYGEFATYYAAKTRAARVFMPYYLPAMLNSEKTRINVLVIAPKNFDEVTKTIGGDWASTGKKFVPERSGFLGTRVNLGFLSTQNYHLEVYRRTDATLRNRAPLD